MTDPHAIASALVRAERDRTPIVPFTRAQPFLSATTAYEAQTLFVEHRLSAGERVVGAKLGLTSKVKRLALGIHEPIYGRLTSSMILPAGETLRVDELIHPRAEPELAFLIGRRIDDTTDLAGALASIEAVLPALDVVDSRYAESFRLPDSVADNAGAARVVLGSEPRSPRDLVELQVLGCVFQQGRTLHTAAGGAVMGHPAAALAWLANTLVARGEHLEEGMIVLSGGLTPSVPLAPGVVATAEFDGPGAVGVLCR